MCVCLAVSSVWAVLVVWGVQVVMRLIMKRSKAVVALPASQAHWASASEQRAAQDQPPGTRQGGRAGGKIGSCGAAQASTGVATTERDLHLPSTFILASFTG